MPQLGATAFAVRAADPYISALYLALKPYYGLISGALKQGLCANIRTRHSEPVKTGEIQPRRQSISADATSGRHRASMLSTVPCARDCVNRRML